MGVVFGKLHSGCSWWWTLQPVNIKQHSRVPSFSSSAFLPSTPVVWTQFFSYQACTHCWATALLASVISHRPQFAVSSISLERESNASIISLVPGLSFSNLWIWNVWSWRAPIEPNWYFLVQSFWLIRKLIFPTPCHACHWRHLWLNKWLIFDGVFLPHWFLQWCHGTSASELISLATGCDIQTSASRLVGRNCREKGENALFR